MCCSALQTICRRQMCQRSERHGAVSTTSCVLFYVRFRGDNVLELLHSTGSAATIVYTTMGYRYTTLHYSANGSNSFNYE